MTVMSLTLWDHFLMGRTNHSGNDTTDRAAPRCKVYGSDVWMPWYVNGLTLQLVNVDPPVRKNR